MSHMSRKSAEPASRTVSRFSLAYLRAREEFVFLLAPGGRITFVSDSVRARLPVGDKLSGRDWWDLWPEAELPGQRAAVARAAAGEAVRATVPVPGDPAAHWDQTISPIHDSDGRVESLMVVLRESATGPESG